MKLTEHCDTDSREKQTMKIYQCGAVTHDKHAEGWRIYLADKCPRHQFWNPIDREREFFETDPMELLTQLRWKATGSQEPLDEIRRIMREIIIPNDMKGLNWADMMVLYVKKDVRLWGSICEAYEMKQQGKPVYIISELSYDQMNHWEIGIADDIWFGLDTAVNKLNAMSEPVETYTFPKWNDND